MKRGTRANIQKSFVPGAPLARGFFQQSPVACARAMIGSELLWRGCGGIIVETEAYSVLGDEACHTFSRPSSRRFVADHPPGTAYIYLNYGVHWLLNFLVKGGPEEGFVLIRALEPTRRIAQMRARRMSTNPVRLCSGPGKLTQALGIDGSFHGLDFLATNILSVSHPKSIPSVLEAKRIGISKATGLLWRFGLDGSPHLSTPMTKNPRALRIPEHC
ncbi:MAG: DNA-3-methyladenine glycosylase [Terrimicrobiaceae bacterium]